MSHTDPPAENQVEAAQAVLDELEEFREEAWNKATEKPTDIPELHGGMIADTRHYSLTDREKVVYQLGRRAGLLTALKKMERALDAPDSVPIYEE